MARGFEIRVGVASADELTQELLAPEVAANGLLTALEQTSFLAYAITAAQALITGLGNGPFVVALHGADHTTDPSDVTTLSATVTSSWTTPKEVPAPAEVDATDAPTSSDPSQEVAPDATVAETSAAPSEGSASETPTAPVVADGPVVTAQDTATQAEGSDPAEPPVV